MFADHRDGGRGRPEQRPWRPVFDPEGQNVCQCPCPGHPRPRVPSRAVDPWSLPGTPAPHSRSGRGLANSRDGGGEPDGTVK